MIFRATSRVGQFVITALAGMTVLSIVIALYVRDVAIEELNVLGISQHETLARTLSATLDHHIQPALDASLGNALENLRGVEEIRALRRYLVEPLHGMRVVRIKIYNRDGRVAFSTDENEIGAIAADNHSFRLAMAGETVAEMVRKDTFNVSDGVIEDRDLLETYVPLVDPATGERVGAFEVYSDMTTLIEQIDATQRRVILGTLLITGLVFAAMILMFRRLDRRLVAEETAAQRYLDELEDARQTLEGRVETRTRALAESEQRFQDVADAAGEYIWEVNEDGRYVFVTDRVRGVTGYTPEELIGRQPLEFAHPADVDWARARVREIGQQPFRDLEHRSIKKNGEVFWQSVSAIARHDENGRYLGYRGTAHDITARKEAESRLRMLSHVIEQSSELVLITNPNGVIEYVNPAFTVMSGYDADETLGRTPRMLRSDETPPEIYEALWSTIVSGKPWRGELRNRRKDGGVFWNQVTIFPLRDEAGEINNYVGLQSDITTRKLGELALMASESRLRAVMNSVTDAIITSAADGRIEMVNLAAASLFGYEPGTLIGMNLRELMPEPYHSEHDGYMSRYLETGQPSIIGLGGREVVGLRRDGTTMPLELGVGEMSNGCERRFVGVLRDLTERKLAQRELERTREQLFHRERMAAIGQLAAGVVHELGNPVAAISGAISNLRRKLERSPSAPDGVITGDSELDLVEQQVERLAGMTREVSDLARPRPIERKLLDLNEIVRSALSLMRFDARVQDIDVRVDLDPSLPAVVASADQITQLTINLLLNAADACGDHPPGAGSVELRTVGEGDLVTLTVTDNGRGMDDDTLAHAMEPYFSTKGGERGLGLGLSLCNDIASEHQGQLSIESEAGAGTRVRLTLPVGGPDGAGRR